ncbi:hypothetical protein CYLTODRAFT_417607 [Cylindrobasidium torrendii FP15055 ss-10]|uniref:Uncharacterized protein n=1 Tax=Cylindrobasidium torrendii FP15055 ss-10 TaxID=1314674 RepID=A0A0D7BQY6_9AGAR|nr:hypothetical protein CYLTODRAFT_417607 [Cylindrobasidium torrendii FP15055 ss-10]
MTAYPAGYAPFAYGTPNQHPGALFQTHQNPNYGYNNNPSTPRFGAGFAHGTPFTNPVPFPSFSQTRSPYTAQNPAFQEASPPPFIPPALNGQTSSHGHAAEHQSSTRRSRHRSNSSPHNAPNLSNRAAVKRSATANAAVPSPTHGSTSSHRHKPRSNSMNQASGTAPNGMPLTRSRTKSDVKASMPEVKREHDDFETEFIYITFQGSNELIVEYATVHAAREIRDEMQAKWPDGIEDTITKGPQMCIKFKGAPWNMSGLQKSLSWDLILGLFKVCAVRGYGLSTVINLGFPPPKLVFVTQPRDKSTRFFLAFFSKNGFRVNIVNAPEVVDRLLSREMEAAFPGCIERNDIVDGVRCIELSRDAAQKKKSRMMRDIHIPSRINFAVDAGYFLLRIINSFARDPYPFRLECTLPLGGTSSWAPVRTSEIGTQKEIYVFSGMEPI